MKTIFLTMALWLAGTGTAMAQDWLKQPEELRFNVSLGLFYLGKATLAYAPDAKGGYTLSARVKDGAPFIEIDDTWTARGSLAGGLFKSREFRAVQRENDYRADKVVTFNAAKKTAVYKNLTSPEPSQTIVLGSGEVRDALSTLYALRAEGVAALAKPRQRVALGSREVLDMSVTAGVSETLSFGSRKVTAQRVNISTYNREKKRTEQWVVWVDPADNLRPLKIEARLKIGTFRAVLQP